ncbi:MAG: type III pantothenate kinase [Cyclobacteriaceae bacterium]
MENKRNITVDIGNTRIKSGLFEGDDLVASLSWGSLEQLKAYLNTTEHDQLGIVSVGAKVDQIANELSSFDPMIISVHSNLPITLDYKTPETLGIDRIVALIGAAVGRQNQNILVVDLGSCITYDLLDASNTYRGGIISPGLEMRMRGMAQFTENLPDIRDQWVNHIPPGLGKSTKECLTAGTYQAIIHELNGFINGLHCEYADLAVILTGGNAPSFESNLKQPIFADLFLVLKGINRILNQ